MIPFNYDKLEENIGLAMKTLIKKGLLHPGNITVVITSMEAGDRVTDVVQMRTV